MEKENKDPICPGCKYYDWDADDMGYKFGCWCEKSYSNLKGFPFRNCKGYKDRYTRRKDNV
ncbi:MAG: hypothetical protein ACRC3H_05280 [Lachnospiraceae bacterium]